MIPTSRSAVPTDPQDTSIETNVYGLSYPVSYYSQLYMYILPTSPSRFWTHLFLFLFSPVARSASSLAMHVRPTVGLFTSPLTFLPDLLSVSRTR
jgi:hypothetical protein